MSQKRYVSRGFTLIELSIVLVIIGLIIGGILVGRDLIAAAETRAQLTQIEKYNTAVNTFKGKYGGLPGDLMVTLASQFGFNVGAGCIGNTNFNRNGDGLIDGWWPGSQIVQGGNETALFWPDLGSSGLIDAQFPNSGGSMPACGGTNLALSLTPGAAYIGDNYPTGKIGYGTFLYVYEQSGFNWYGLSAVTGIFADGELHSNAAIPVIEAYNMDKKVDDGIPISGNIQAIYITGNIQLVNAPNLANDSKTTCYNTSLNTYSLGTAAGGGSGHNCALSFKFQ